MRRPVGRPSKYDQRYCDEVERVMGGGYSLTMFAGLIGVARNTLDTWCKAHPEFMGAVSRAKAKRLLFWEQAAIAIASGGTGGPGAGTVVVFGLKNMGGDEWSVHPVRKLG